MSELQMVDFKNIAFELCQAKNEQYFKISLEELEENKNTNTCYGQHDFAIMKDQLEQEKEVLSKNFGDILKILGVGMFRNDFQIKTDKNVKYVVPEDEVQFFKDLIVRYRESYVWKKILKQRNEKIPYDIMGRYQNLSIDKKIEVTEELKKSVVGLIRIYKKIQKYKVNRPEYGLSQFELTERQKEFITCIYRETALPALAVMEPTFRRYEELLFWGLGKRIGTEFDYQIEADLSLIFVDLANEMTELLKKTLERMHRIFAKRKLEFLYAGIPVTVESEDVMFQDEKGATEKQDTHITNMLDVEYNTARKKYQNRAKQEILKEEIVKQFKEELEKCKEEDKSDVLALLTYPMTLEDLEVWESQMKLEDNKFFQEISTATTIEMLLEIIRKYEEEQDK